MIYNYEIDGLPVQTGDILCASVGSDRFALGRFWSLFGQIVPGPVDHVAIYIGPGGRCVESGPVGVTVFEVEGNTWNPSQMAGQRGRLADTLYGVAYPLAGKGFTAQQEEAIRRDVADYCLQQAAADKPYNFNYANPDTERSYYCSQLVYLAYLRHGIDLNIGPGILGVEATDCIVLPQEIWDGCFHQRVQPSHRQGADPGDAVRRAVYAEFFWLLGLPDDSPWRRWLQPLLQPVVGRFVDLVAEFDQAVARVGLPAAIRPYVPQFVEHLTVAGADTLPARGPLLIVSNHPGAFDLFLVLSQLPRDDVRVIVSEISILHRLPATDAYFVSLGAGARDSVSAARTGVKHLQAGGALFLFPGGIVDPDPAFMSGAVDSLARWSPSLDLFLRRAPETQVVVAIASGVLSPGWFNSPVTRLRQERKDRQKVAEACQIGQQLLWPRSIRLHPLLTFDRPLSVAELSRGGTTDSCLPEIRKRARLLLALRNAVPPQALA